MNLFERFRTKTQPMFGMLSTVSDPTSICLYVHYTPLHLIYISRNKNLSLKYCVQLPQLGTRKIGGPDTKQMKVYIWQRTHDNFQLVEKFPPLYVYTIKILRFQNWALKEYTCGFITSRTYNLNCRLIATDCCKPHSAHVCFVVSQVKR